MESASNSAPLTRRGLWEATKEAFGRFRELELTDRAAALTYYGVLAVFPGMIVLVGLLGVLGDERTVDGVLRIVDELGPSSAVDAFEDPVRGVVEHSSGAGIAVVAGFAGALWTASGYVGAFGRAANDVYGVEEDRPFWRQRPIQVGITLGMLAALAVALLAVLLSGPLAEAVGNELGIGDEVVTAYGIAKWPALFLIAALAFAALLYTAPNVEHRGFRWMLPGGLVATALWLAGSAAFAAYVANFSSYSSTYGGLAGVMVFLIWNWVSNCALLFGIALNAALETGGGAED